MNGRTYSTLSLISNGRNGVTSNSFPVTLHQEVPRDAGQFAMFASGQSANRSDCWDLKEWMKNNKHKLPRFLIMSIFVCIAAYQVTEQLIAYSGYPTGVNVLVDEPSSLREALPGITLCHNNRFMKSKINQMFQTWQQKYKMDESTQEMYDNQIKPLNSSRFEQLFFFRQFIEDEFDSEKPIHLLSHFTITAEEFIKYLKCDPSFSNAGESTTSDCEDYPVIQFLHFTGRCFTLFHKLASISGVSEKIGFKRKNTLVKNPKNHVIEGGDFIPINENDDFSLSPTNVSVSSETVTTSDTDTPAKPYDFAPNEIVQIMVNFTPSELMDPYAEASGRIYVHDIAHIPGMEEIHFDIQPGYYYEFYIRAIQTNQLQAPYNTNCTDYYESAVEKIKETGDLGYPLTQSECIHECLIEQTLSIGGMIYPPEAPWFKNSKYKNRSLTNPDERVRPHWGNWRKAHASKEARKRYYGTALIYLPGCLAKCGIDCRHTTYEVITAKDRWPFKDIIETASAEEKIRIDEMQQTAAFISIRYSTYVRTVRDFEARFDSLPNFIAGIGGLVSMWIGISAISLYDSISGLVIAYKSSH